MLICKVHYSQKPLQVCVVEEVCVDNHSTVCTLVITQSDEITTLSLVQLVVLSIR